MIYFFKSSYIRVNVEKNYDNVTVKEKYPVFFFFVFCSVLLFGLVTLLCLLGGFFVYLFGFGGCGGEGGVLW